MARALTRLAPAGALVVAPLACASSQPAPLSSPAAHSPPRQGPSYTQIRDRDRALVAGLATSLALGLVGLGTLLANSTFAKPQENTSPADMPATMAIAGGVMSLGFLTAVPFGVAVERHRARYPDLLRRGRAPRPSASLRPTAPLRP